MRHSFVAGNNSSISCITFNADDAFPFGGDANAPLIAPSGGDIGVIGYVD